MTHNPHLGFPSHRQHELCFWGMFLQILATENVIFPSAGFVLNMHTLLSHYVCIVDIACYNITYPIHIVELMFKYPSAELNSCHILIWLESL